ncbi:MAG: cupin [Lentisphaerae bacterium GWF2_52_8]|nr:MAG: cupin [Lentisphaerae bacterium GWF2_52_8]
MVAYGENSVVSRSLAENKSGTMTLFSFDESQGLSEHSAPYDAIVQLIEGEAEISIAGVPHRLCAGQMIIMPANIPHSVRAVSKFKMLLSMFRV